MSGPLSNKEIEDVVTSVRRLVSAEPRPRPDQRPVSRDLGHDKLILTPALQVAPDQPASAPLILSAPVADAPVKTPEITPGSGPETPDTLGLDPDPDAAVLVEAEWEDELWHEPDTSLAELALGVEEAELVQSPAATDAIPAAGNPAEDVSDTVVRLADAARPTPKAESAPRLVPVPEPDSEPVPEPTAVPASEPDAVAEDAQQGTQTLVDHEGNPLTVLDEDALHEIVRSLIREELQGVLGERITRSVRKLVRAEINRALTARALD